MRRDVSKRRQTKNDEQTPRTHPRGNLDDADPARTVRADEQHCENGQNECRCSAVPYLLLRDERIPDAYREFVVHGALYTLWERQTQQEAGSGP